MRQAATRFFTIVAVVGASLLIARNEPSLSAERYLSHIRFLASADDGDRASGSPELETAAKYIMGSSVPTDFKRWAAAIWNRSEVTTSSKLGKGNRFESVRGGEPENLQIGKEFIPYNFSSSGKAAGQVVFAGYGITAPEYSYDDYAGLDVKGKFVVVLAHEPQEFDGNSVFDGTVYTDHSQAYSKAANARRHGARGVILIFDRVNHPNDKEVLESFGSVSGPADAGILFVQVEESIAEPWIRAAGKDLGVTESAINTDLKPRSFALPDVEIQENVDINRVVKTVHNVIGYLPGESLEYIIVGANYDHLGLGAQFSMAPSMAGTVHPGADDNASGTAGVLELAQYFAAGPKPKRGILFMTYAGEELGLLGSEFYVDHPILPLQQATAMINMDMIGRVRDDKLYIGGAATGSTFRGDLDEIVPATGFRVDYSDSGYGSSRPHLIYF